MRRAAATGRDEAGGASVGRRRAAIVCAVVASAAIGAPGTARADGDVAAEALFRAGRAAAEKGDNVTACAKFQESERLDPAPGTLLNIADCSEKLGRTATAWKSYAEAVDRMPADDDRRAPAIERRDALAKTLSHLRVSVEGTAGSCKLAEDGVEVGEAAWTEPLPVDPGPHEVTLACAGRATSTVKIDVAAEHDANVAIAPGNAARASTDRMPAISVAGWVIGGIGLAGVGAGLVTGGLVLDRKSKVEDLCTHTTPPRCPKAGLDAASEGRTLSAVSTATFVSGLVLLGTGATLVIVGATKRPSEAPTAALLVGPGNLEVRGAF